MMQHFADKSFIAESGWYGLVFCNENTCQFPDVKLLLGIYLGPTDP
jgi:hypothetical protein